MTNQTVAAYLRSPGSTAISPVLDLAACESMREQGVAPLVYRALCDRHLLDEQPREVRERLVQTAREEAALDSFRHDEVVRALEGLEAEGVHPLLFKGAALAYTCYPESWLRPRLDTDLLIRRDHIAAASRVFERLGYTRAARPSGEHVTHQFTYVSTRHGLQTAFDVHWKLADPQAFADVFSYEELDREAVAVPELGSTARTLSDVHALLVACTHRVAHHYDRDMLIFLYDIDLLARRLSQSEWDRVVTIAAEKRIRAVTGRGLDLASGWLGSPVPVTVGNSLAEVSEAEPTALYLSADLRKIDILWSDLRELKGWRARLRLIREHLLPPRAFILRSYGQTRLLLLPSLYLHRILRGALLWFRTIR